jgi:energy-coupling factor transport system ATP-binding protein
MEHASFAYLGQPIRAIEIEKLIVEKGESVLVAGKSGGGKSTLVNCVNGVIPHIISPEPEISSLQSVKVFGKVVSDTNLRDLSLTVGTLLQDPETQILNYVVKEEVAFGPENLCLPSPEIRERIAEAMATTDITSLQDRETYNLSGGELQRTCLAAVLAMKPDVLILDEPTSNIDPEGTAKILDALSELKRKKTLLVVEHKVERILPFVDRIVLVDEGRIRLDIPKEKLIEHVNELLAAGVEVPEHYVYAQRLGLADPALDAVKSAIRRSGTELPLPSRTTPSRTVLTADVSVSFTNRVLVDASLQIGKGEVLALVGRNGAGKSTLMKAVVGFLEKGLSEKVKLTIDGEDMSTASISERGRYLAYVPQSFDLALIEGSVEEELAFSLKNRKVKNYREVVERFLEMFSLSQYRYSDPLNLSVGERRRVVMASALASGVEIVLFDEPTSGQDFLRKQILGKELSELKKMGYSFVVITHDSRFVYWYADRMVVLSEGHKVLEGTPEQVFQSSEQYGVVPPSDFLLRCP